MRVRVDARGDLVEVLGVVHRPLVEVERHRLQDVRRRRYVDDPRLLVGELLHPRQVCQRFGAHRHVGVVDHLTVPLDRLRGEDPDVANRVSLPFDQHGVADVERVNDKDEDDRLEQLLDAVAKHKHKREQHRRRREPHLHDVLIEYPEHDEHQEEVQRGQDDALERGEDARGAREGFGEVASPLVNFHESSHDLLPPQNPRVLRVQHLHDLLPDLRGYPEPIEEVMVEGDEAPGALQLSHDGHRAERRRFSHGSVNDVGVDELGKIAAHERLVGVLHELLRQTELLAADVRAHAMHPGEGQVRGLDRSLLHHDHIRLDRKLVLGQAQEAGQAGHLAVRDGPPELLKMTRERVRAAAFTSRRRRRREKLGRIARSVGGTVGAGVVVLVPLPHVHGAHREQGDDDELLRERLDDRVEVRLALEVNLHVPRHALAERVYHRVRDEARGETRDEEVHLRPFPARRVAQQQTPRHPQGYVVHRGHQLVVYAADDEADSLGDDVLPVQRHHHEVHEPVEDHASAEEERAHDAPAPRLRAADARGDFGLADDQKRRPSNAEQGHGSHENLQRHAHLRELTRLLQRLGLGLLLFIAAHAILILLVLGLVILGPDQRWDPER